MIRNCIVKCTAPLLAFAALAAPGSAQVASALLVEDGPLPGGPGGAIVDSLNNAAVNHVGGYACSLTSDGISYVWGEASGGPGGVMRVESTIGDLEQTSFESFYGISDSGQVCYSAISNNTNSGATSLDGVWLDDVVVAIEEDPVITLPGQFWTFASRPGVTAGGTPYWVGGYSDTQGGSTQARGLFSGLGQTVIMQAGDVLPNTGTPIGSGSDIDFDFRFSANGTNNMSPVNLDSSSTDDGVMTLNAEGLLIDGSLVREASPLPAAAGGLPGENWDNFDFVGVTESGTYFFTGDSDGDTATDEFVVQNGLIIYREGDIVDGFELSGSIEGAYQNENADIAFIWDVEDPMLGNIEALYLNGQCLLKEGDPVDFDGDGVVDPGAVVTNFTGISSMVLSDRAFNGGVNVYFTADVDEGGTVLEGFFCLPVLLPECYLVIGPGPGTTAFNPAGGHTFWPQVADVDAFQPVLLSDLGEILLPPLHTSPFGNVAIEDYSSPTPVMTFAAQVMMWNPIVFPQQPEQSSYPVFVSVFSNGGVMTRQYGEGTGMELWVERGVNLNGEPVLRFPFTIPGI